MTDYTPNPRVFVPDMNRLAGRLVTGDGEGNSVRGVCGGRGEWPRKNKQCTGSTASEALQPEIFTVKCKCFKESAEIVLAEEATPLVRQGKAGMGENKQKDKQAISIH